MAELSVFRGDIHFDGTVTAARLSVPASSITNDKVAADAAIATTKLLHRRSITAAQGNSDDAAVSKTKPLHVVRAAGTVIAFNAGCVVANIGAATVTVDLKKNGASILTAVIEIDSGDAAYAKLNGAIATAPVVAGDVLEYTVVATAGGGTVGKGLFANLVIDEAAQ